MTYTKRTEDFNMIKILKGYGSESAYENCCISANLYFCLDMKEVEDIVQSIKKESEYMIKELSIILSKISDDYEIIPKWEVEEMKNKIKALEEDNDLLKTKELHFVLDCNKEVFDDED